MIAVSPASASIVLGSEEDFTVTVTGLANPAVTWSVNGIPGGNATLGTIRPTSGGAVYSTTRVPSPNPVTIMAVSQADPSVSGQASLTVLFPSDTAQAQAFPIRLGTSGGNATDISLSGASVACCSGTLGCLVERGGGIFILSNNHVLDKSGQGIAGDPICQPGLTDNHCNPGTRVAGLAESAPLMTSNVDAALARVDPGAVDLSGAILDLGAAGPTSIAPAPPSATLADPASLLTVHARVSKVGRSTGLTCAVLSSVDAAVQVDYSSSCGGPTAFTVTFHHQVIIDGATFSDAGDSGALIVTSDSARPLGLLFAGNGSNTAAHPIGEVLGALKDSSSGEIPQIVGGPDHPVSCAGMALPKESTQQALLAGAPTALEFSRVRAARERLGTALLADPAVAGIGIGTSADHPSEGALLVYLRGRPASPLPRALGGVRTRVVWSLSEGAPDRVEASEIERARKVKDVHWADMLAKPGVVGVGVGLSKDAPGEPAIVLYVERGGAFAGVDAELDAVRTQIVEGERFRTFGWGNSNRSTPAGCCGQK
jgi:hypothetical protein